jgi:hypothetical protein
MNLDTLDLSSYCDHPDGLDVFRQIAQRALELPAEYPFIEIGNYRGGTALHCLDLMRLSNKDRFMITVDPYGTKPFILGQDVFPDAIYDEKIYRDAMEILGMYSKHHELNHVHYRMKSDDFIKMWDKTPFYYKGLEQPKKFALVYLDGDHNPEQVERELKYFLPRLVKGGIIILDDATYVESDYPNFQTVQKGRLMYDNFRIYYQK